MPDRSGNPSSFGVPGSQKIISTRPRNPSAAIDQKPAVQKTYLEVARLARENQYWVQAVEIMNRAIAHDPQNKEALDQLIGALIKAGNGKLAAAWSEYRKDLGK